MSKVLFVLHQKTSVPGDVGNKFLSRGFQTKIVRPPLGDELPSDLKNYSAVVIFGAPGSINDDEEFIQKELGEATPSFCIASTMGATKLAAMSGSELNDS